MLLAELNISPKTKYTFVLNSSHRGCGEVCIKEGWGEHTIGYFESNYDRLEKYWRYIWTMCEIYLPLDSGSTLPRAGDLLVACFTNLWIQLRRDELNCGHSACLFNAGGLLLKQMNSTHSNCAGRLNSYHTVLSDLGWQITLRCVPFFVAYYQDVRKLVVFPPCFAFNIPLEWW